MSTCILQVLHLSPMYFYQGRTQEFFPGGARLSTILEGKRRRGCGRGVSPLPHEGAFAFLRLKLNDLVHTLGGFFGGNLNKKSIKKIHIHGKCVFLTLR